MKIIHIIVQNNTYYSARSRWTKQQHYEVLFSNLNVDDSCKWKGKLPTIMGQVFILNNNNSIQYFKMLYYKKIYFL